MNPGMLYASLAFLCWGLFPLYFHAIGEIAPQEILAHRMVWSLLFLGIVLTVRRQWSWLGSLKAQPRVVAGFVASAFLLSANWFIYIWAVNNGHVVDASLGYFITPLINVMLGFMLLHERLRRLQWLAIGLAACGVAWLTWQAGQVPWIALLLAATFGGYGLLPLALAYMLWLAWHGQSGFVNTDSSATRALLLASGPITAIPLLLFAAGARRLPLAVLGLLQYIAPTGQLLIGVWVFHESFTPERMLGFLVIWTALALYAAEGLWNSRRARASV